MELFKDGKYVIGFLVGVICSFVIMGGIKNYQGINGGEVSDTQTPSGEQVKGGESEPGDENYSTNGQKFTTPEDPHSPELKRLALILRETERMIERLKKEIESTGAEQQVATALNQN